jgi:hypothetical protein
MKKHYCILNEGEQGICITESRVQDKGLLHFLGRGEQDIPPHEQLIFRARRARQGVGGLEVNHGKSTRQVDDEQGR